MTDRPAASVAPAASVPVIADTRHGTVGPDGVVQRVRLAAYAWVERDERVLLVRIASTDPGAGHWTLPGGGLDFGEDPADGVLRELREETGLTGTVGALLAVRSVVLDPATTKSGDRIQAVGLLYRVEADAGDLVMEVDGSTDLAAWVPFAELDALPVVPLGRWARTAAGR
jgi:ADP-ribose pyrophosphatase YjhB (NUDIX family)